MAQIWSSARFCQPHAPRPVSNQVISPLNPSDADEPFAVLLLRRSEEGYGLSGEGLKELEDSYAGSKLSYAYWSAPLTTRESRSISILDSHWNRVQLKPVLNRSWGCNGESDKDECHNGDETLRSMREHPELWIYLAWLLPDVFEDS